MLRRREVIGLLGGAAVSPVVARAQKSGMPVIGLLDNRAAETTADRLRGFYRGLKENGFIEGESVSIVYRWAEGDYKRLPAMADDLVRRQVAVIAATGATPAALAAKKATSTIPIVFAVPEDPVGLGLVASLAHPGGNLTGVNFFNSEVSAKRLELLRELDYGTDVTDAFRQVGLYVGKILRGHGPNDLPAVQATKFQLVINAQTARLLEISVPPQLLARADEVIE